MNNMHNMQEKMQLTGGVAGRHVHPFCQAIRTKLTALSVPAIVAYKWKEWHGNIKESHE